MLNLKLLFCFILFTGCKKNSDYAKGLIQYNYNGETERLEDKLVYNVDNFDGKRDFGITKRSLEKNIKLSFRSSKVVKSNLIYKDYLDAGVDLNGNSNKRCRIYDSKKGGLNF